MTFCSTNNSCNGDKIFLQFLVKYCKFVLTTKVTGEIELIFKIPGHLSLWLNKKYRENFFENYDKKKNFGSLKLEGAMFPNLRQGQFLLR